MKNLLRNALLFKNYLFNSHQSFTGVVRQTAFLVCPILFILLSSGCNKEGLNMPRNEIQNANRPVSKSESIATDKAKGNVVKDYPGLSKQTLWELQQARAATAKYRNIENALKDGYEDIGVVVEGMGHHYMKLSIVDGTFTIREPEMLVYNRDGDGNMELVAVEYAIPFAFGQPQGFTGTDDVWDGNAGVSLWLLHAWVWRYNPEGVFNPTNPLVHLH